MEGAQLVGDLNTNDNIECGSCNAAAEEELGISSPEIGDFCEELEGAELVGDTSTKEYLECGSCDDEHFGVFGKGVCGVGRRFECSDVEEDDVIYGSSKYSNPVAEHTRDGRPELLASDCEQPSKSCASADQRSECMRQKRAAKRAKQDK